MTCFFKFSFCEKIPEQLYMSTSQSHGQKMLTLMNCCFQLQNLIILILYSWRYCVVMCLSPDTSGWGKDEMNFLHSQCQRDTLNKKCCNKICMTMSSGMNDESRGFRSCLLAALTDWKHFFKNVIGKLR